MDQSSVKKVVSCLGYARRMLAKQDLHNVMQHVDASLHLLKHAAVMKDKGRLSKTFTQADPLLG